MKGGDAKDAHGMKETPPEILAKVKEAVRNEYHSRDQWRDCVEGVKKQAPLIGYSRERASVPSVGGSVPEAGGRWVPD
jgi:hypothetical protein